MIPRRTLYCYPSGGRNQRRQEPASLRSLRETRSQSRTPPRPGSRSTHDITKRLRYSAVVRNTLVETRKNQRAQEFLYLVRIESNLLFCFGNQRRERYPLVSWVPDAKPKNGRRKRQCGGTMSKRYIFVWRVFGGDFKPELNCGLEGGRLSANFATAIQIITICILDSVHTTSNKHIQGSILVEFAPLHFPRTTSVSPTWCSGPTYVAYRDCTQTCTCGPLQEPS